MVSAGIDILSLMNYKLLQFRCLYLYFHAEFTRVHHKSIFIKEIFDIHHNQIYSVSKFNSLTLQNIMK